MDGTDTTDARDTGPPAPAPLAPSPRARRRAATPGLGAALGAAMVDLEQHLLRARPRVEERHRRRDEVTLAAADGSTVTVGLPDTDDGPDVPGDAER